MKTNWLIISLIFFGRHLSGQILEIHQINIGIGDATMIVVRDTAKLRASMISSSVPIPAATYKWLEAAVDGGADLKGTVKMAVLIDAGMKGKSPPAINAYKNSMGVGDFKYIIVSHMHDDHYGGIKDLLNKYAIKAETIILRNNRPNYKTVRKTDIGLPKKDPPPILEAFHNSTDIKLSTEAGSPVQLTCLAGAMLTAFQPTTVTQPTSSREDENNHSLVWALQFGAFRYYTGGDLNGYTDVSDNPSKIDLESSLMDSLLVHDPATLQTKTGGALNKGHFCSLKINHHGGEESTNPYFLAVMKPTTAIISCGAGGKNGKGKNLSNGYRHPRIRVIVDLDATILDQDDVNHPKWDLTKYAAKGLVKLNGNTMVDKTIEKYFMTNLDTIYPTLYNFYKQIGNSTKSRGIIAGDIVTVVDSSNPLQSAYYVFWNGKKGTTVNSSPNRLKRPNEKGGEYFTCHKSADLLAPPYLINHK